MELRVRAEVFLTGSEAHKRITKEHARSPKENRERFAEQPQTAGRGTSNS